MSTATISKPHCRALLPLIVALLTSSCVHHTRPSADQTNRYLLTPSDITLLEQQHATTTPQLRAGMDGREISDVCADDYLDDHGMSLLVEKMPNLRMLSLMLCDRVTDKGLKQIAALPELRILSLHYTKITDRSIRQILQLKHLEWLNVSGTAVTASGLATLAQLPKLPMIDASVIAFSADEMTMLKRVLGKAINFD